MGCLFHMGCLSPIQLCSPTQVCLQEQPVCVPPPSSCLARCVRLRCRAMKGLWEKHHAVLGSPTAPLAAVPAAHTCLLQESLRTTFSVVPGLGFSTCVWARSCNHSHYGWKSPLRSARPTISPAPSPWSPLNHVPTCHLHTFFEPSQGWWLQQCPGQPCQCHAVGKWGWMLLSSCRSAKCTSEAGAVSPLSWWCASPGSCVGAVRPLKERKNIVFWCTFWCAACVCWNKPLISDRPWLKHGQNHFLFASAAKQ